MSEIKFRYRVAINNNFRKCYAYLDFKKFGIITDFTAFFGNSTGPNSEETLNSIGIYNNYKTIGIVDSKAKAIKILEDLVDKCPEDGKKDYEEYKEFLFRSLK